MKILQITQRFYPSIGGSQNIVYQLSKNLAAQGHEVTVVTTNSLNNKDIRGFSTARSFKFKNSCPNLPKFEIKDNIKIYRFQPIWQFWTYLINPSMFLFLWKEIKKYDLIHTHCYMFSEPDITAFINIFKKVPIIFTAHDIVSPFKGIGGFFKKVYDFTVGKLILKKADYLIALTNENKKQYLELGDYENKIRIIPDGIDYQKISAQFKNVTDTDINLTRSKLGNPDKIILFVGRLIQYKGVQYILKSIPGLIKKNKYQKLKFVFIGEDQGYKNNLLEIAKIYQVENYCYFTGKISQEELCRYYKAADLFVLPSTGEAFGLVSIESILAGAYPILASSGGLKFILQNIGGKAILMNQNTNDIINQIEKNINIICQTSKEELQQDLKQMQNKIYKKFDWPVILHQTEQLYLQAIKQ